MNVLVTGGAGYIGCVLTPCLLEKRWSVTVIDNFMYRQESLNSCCQYENFTVIRGDCRDERLIKPLVNKADVIIPLAAIVGAPACDRNVVAARTTNLEAIANLCAAASVDQWIIFPTTNSGYG